MNMIFSVGLFALWYRLIKKCDFNFTNAINMVVHLDF